MTSQLIVGKELRRLGKGVIDLARSRRLSQVGGGGVTRTYLVALGLFCVLPIGATAALYYSIPNETLTASDVYKRQRSRLPPFVRLRSNRFAFLI